LCSTEILACNFLFCVILVGLGIRVMLILYKCLPQETRKTSNIQPKFTPQGTTKGAKAKVSKEKEITKAIAEINEIKT